MRIHRLSPSYRRWLHEEGHAQPWRRPTEAIAPHASGIWSQVSTGPLRLAVSPAGTAVIAGGAAVAWRSMPLLAAAWIAGVRWLATMRVADLDSDGQAYAWERSAIIGRWLVTGQRPNNPLASSIMTIGIAHGLWAAFAAAIAITSGATVGLVVWLGAYGVLATFTAAHLWSRVAKRRDMQAAERARRANVTESDDAILAKRFAAIGIKVPCKVLNVKRDEYGEVWLLRIATGYTVGDIKRDEARLATTKSGAIWCEVTDAAGHDKRHAAISWKFAERVTVPDGMVEWRTPDGSSPVGAITSIADPIPFGVEVTTDGKLVPYFIRLGDRPHVIVNGGSGGGKSNDMHMLVGAAHMAADAKLWICDAKAGLEFGSFEAHCHRFADSPSSAVGVVLDYLRAMNAKARRMRQAGQRKATPTADEPWNILVIDELATLVRSLSNDQRKEFEAGFMTCMEQGRAIGFQMIVGTQAPRADTISVSGWRANFGWTVGVRTQSDTDSRVILGDDSQAQGFGLKNLPSHPGARITRDANGYHRVFAPFVPDSLLDKIIAAGAGTPGSSGSLFDPPGSDSAPSNTWPAPETPRDSEGVSQGGFAGVSQPDETPDDDANSLHRGGFEDEGVSQGFGGFAGVSLDSARDALTDGPRKVLEVLDESSELMTATEIADRLGISVQATRGHLRALHAAGLAVETGRRWRLIGRVATTAATPTIATPTARPVTPLARAADDVAVAAVLGIIQRNPGARLQGIAAAARLSETAVRGVLDRLAADGRVRQLGAGWVAA